MKTTGEIRYTFGDPNNKADLNDLKGILFDTIGGHSDYLFF